MSDFSDVLDTLIPLVGGVIVDKAKNEITKLSEDADDPTKQIVFALMAEAVGELGEDGLDIAEAPVDVLVVADAPWESLAPRIERLLELLLIFHREVRNLKKSRLGQQIHRQARNDTKV